MPYAIIRGKNGRRHEVDFGDAPVGVEIHPAKRPSRFSSRRTSRRSLRSVDFAILNIPRHLFSEATARAARRAAHHPVSDYATQPITPPSLTLRGRLMPGGYSMQDLADALV